jgi:thiol-disulfide isomerase/thioredoxin
MAAVRTGGATLSILIDFLRRQDPELKFKLPSETQARSVEMSFGGQSIGDALEEICSLFNVSYQIDADGTIIIQPGAQVRNELLQRSYWLKTDAFKPATVREVLTAKGISFANGSSVTWTPVFRQLNVTNTTENHNKLADLLESEFGGTAGSPTHWLSLTSGARFGLIIDKFAPDAVVGHHPVYGACRIPLSDINLIRTSIPDATEAMKSVADWRLVFAPEPVLPESPGESSPLLGQLAKGFKLPLLGGGEFDLASQQGKVIILDFWATWCGPCIKSLPGLIDAVSKLPGDKVKLIGVNQGEPPEQVKQFIETRRWALTVALDSSQNRRTRLRCGWHSVHRHRRSRRQSRLGPHRVHSRRRSGSVQSCPATAHAPDFALTLLPRKPVAAVHSETTFHLPHNRGVSSASLGTSAVMAVALLLQ